MTSASAARLLLRCDGSAKIGLGHVMRLLSLGQAARARGTEVRFVMREEPQVEAIVAAQGFPLDRLAADLPREAEAAALLPLSSAGDWLVVDGYGFDDVLLGPLRRSGLRLGALVDSDAQADRCRQAHLLVNPNLHARPASPQAPGESRAVRLAGSAFALVRAEFREAAARRRTRLALAIPGAAAQPWHLLVMFGGSDVAGLTPRTLAYLGADAAALAPLQVTVVLGPSSLSDADTRAVASQSPFPVRVAKGPEDLALIMAAADAAVTAAGTTVLELLCLGVPPVMITVVDNQAGIARSVAGRGAGVDLGGPADLSRAGLRAALATVRAAGTAMAEAGPGLCDGRGADRVLDAMADLHLDEGTA